MQRIVTDIPRNVVKTALSKSRNITDVFDYVINDTFKSRNVNSNDVISNHTSNIT